MAQDFQNNIPLSLNLDKNPKHLSAEECFYLLNHERRLNEDGSKRGTLGKTSPKAANYMACEMELPSGENYSVGEYYSALTNETYTWIYNSNAVHYIQRINGDGECEVVYHGCLELSADPKHKITNFRAYMRLEKLCANRDGKQLIWTNGVSDIGMLDTEASIATNYFTTPFFQRCGDPCAYVRMCVPDPCGCLLAEFVPLSDEDAGKKNNIADIGFQFAYRHVYYDNRASIWSDPSTTIFLNSRGCFESAEGLPRCIKLRVPIGNPLVEKIEIAFKMNGAWYLTETVEKYKKYNDSQEKWYQRDLAELTNYADEDCSFDYIFCNDKNCDPIDPKEMERVYNPHPREAQGILPIGLNAQEAQSLGFYNYKDGTCPIDRREVEKMDISIKCSDAPACDVELATIKVRAIIHNRSHDRNQFVYRKNGAFIFTEDDPADRAWFGAFTPDGGLESGYDQYFREETRNFIAYIEGTSYWAEMKQWRSSLGFTTPQEVGIVSNMDNLTTQTIIKQLVRNGGYFFQQIELKVPKGTKGFVRLASHQATGNNQDSSTFVGGIITDITQYKGDIGTSGLNAILNSRIEEIYVDTCDGDVDEMVAFLIDDNAADDDFVTKSSAYSGYVRDANGLPIEGAIVAKSSSSSVTDHNGFYHLVEYPGTDNPITLNVKVEQDCFNFTSIKTVQVSGEPGYMTEYNIDIDDEDYKDGFYATVKQRVVDCNGVGVGGIRVALSGSKYKTTGPDGIALFRIRNYEQRDRVVRSIVLNNKGCFTHDCDNECNPCMPSNTSATIPCYLSEPVINLTNAVINTSASGLQYGLKSGGLYPFAIRARGDCGRISAAYEVNTLYIPKLQERNSELFCQLHYDATGMVLPSWVKCVDILRSKNLNPFELQWVVDEVERTDDGKIKLTIQSLNDYNANYFFKTNTVYQWLKNDRVEFIKNGDGSIFSSSTHGILNYLTLSPFHDEQVSGSEEQPADYFNQLLINDDGRLDNLTKGAVIELQRGKSCTTEPVYFSICTTIPVVNGRLLYEVGDFTSFDTYRVTRVIGQLPIQAFEHHSPSDFWGDHLDDTGRAYFVNQYENEKRFGRNMTINVPGQYNYFGDLVKTLNPISHGDIIAMLLKDDRIGICISEHDNSMFQVADDFLRVGSDGIVRSAGIDAVVSNTQSKVRGEYGCQYPHIGSIYFGDGWATWCDVNKHCFVMHDFSEAVAVDKGKAETHFRKRCQELETHNRNQSDHLNHMRFSTGYNYQNGELYLTIKRLRDGAIYNEIKPFLKINDTISFDPETRDFTGYVSFTPEGYSRLNLFNGSGCAFVSFYNGIPYVHPIIPDKFNEFYGIACDRVIGIAINKNPKKVKKALSIEIQDETMWFVADVSVENPNFKSEIPAIRWSKDERHWNANFLGNINSRGGLYGDETPRDYYIAVTFVRDNTDSLKYRTTDNAKRVKYDSLDMINFKFMTSEESGFTENL